MGERKADDNTDPNTSATATAAAGGGGGGGAAAGAAAGGGGSGAVAEPDDDQTLADPLSQVFDRFGLCADEGALWVEWVVPPQYLQAALSFGVIAHAAAVDPDAR